jgi:predicted acyltransferase
MSVPSAETVRGAATPVGTGGRLVSLDVFRGATIAAMILVNNPGDWTAVYAPLRHAQWHGWTFTDLVFPFFLWIVGVAMTLSFAKRVERGDNRGRLLVHTARRAAIIFALGLFLNGFPFFHLATWRIPGVLQRIAVCYLIAAVIFLFTSWRGQAIWTLSLLVGYWMLMTLVPAPGISAGSLEKGANLAQYIDGLVLGKHMWAVTRTWDPEGIISTLPAIATTLFGILTGHVLRSARTAAEKTAWMFFGGNALVFAGLVMNVWMPINKNLWTSSFSVFMAGMALIVFACCYWLVDVKGYRSWSRPFAIYGMNAIAVYVLAGMLETLLDVIHVSGPPKPVSLHGFLYQHLFAPLMSPVNASLLWAACCVLAVYLVAYGMYRRKWFIKV